MPLTPCDRPSAWLLCGTRLPTCLDRELGRFREGVGAAFISAGRIEVLKHVSSLRPGQFSRRWGGGLHKRNVAYRDVLLSFREPMMPEEEDEIWVGCIFMLMSNVSSLLRILLQGDWRFLGGRDLSGPV